MNSRTTAGTSDLSTGVHPALVFANARGPRQRHCSGGAQASAFPKEQEECMSKIEEAKRRRLEEIALRMEQLIAEERALGNEAVEIEHALRQQREGATGGRQIRVTMTLGPSEIIVRSQNWQRTIRFEGHRMDKMVGWITDMLASLKYGYVVDADPCDVKILSTASFQKMTADDCPAAGAVRCSR